MEVVAPVEVAVAVVAVKMEVVVVVLFRSLKLKIKVAKSYFVILQVRQNCFKIEYVIKIFLQNLKSGNYLTRVLMNYIFQKAHGKKKNVPFPI